MNSYLCPICNKKHKVYPGLEVPPPQWINELPPAEKEARIKEFDGIILVDEARVFLKVTVEIFLEKENNPCFTWNCWGETSIQEFGPSIPKLQQGETVSFTGTMPQIPTYYEPREDLAVRFTTFPEEGKTVVAIETDSRIKVDQSHPITKDRLIELMNRLHHHPERKESEKDSRPFSDRLLECLQKAKSEFTDQGKQVCITVHHAPAIGLQIVSSSILEFMEGEAIGLGLHLPFDEEDAALKRFKEHHQFGDFQHHVLDGIPTWQRDFGEDVVHLQKVMQRLLVDVFEVDSENLELDIFEL